MILLLHHRYRHAGGEERAVEDLARLIPAHPNEGGEIRQRESRDVGPAGAAAGLLAGGLDAHEVADAVTRTGARVVHAHNTAPTFGWRALAAARGAGARGVLHLPNYPLRRARGPGFPPGGDRPRRPPPPPRPGGRPGPPRGPRGGAGPR